MLLIGFNLSDAGELQADIDTSRPPTPVSQGELTRLSLSNSLLYVGRPDNQFANEVTLARLGLQLNHYEPGFKLDLCEISGMIIVRLPNAPRRRLYQEGERPARAELKGSPIYLRYDMVPEESRKVRDLQRFV